MQTIDLVKKIVEALEDKKAEDITVLDIGGVSSIADYFIIANGNNANQLTAMEDAVDEAMYTNGVHQKQVEPITALHPSLQDLYNAVYDYCRHVRFR